MIEVGKLENASQKHGSQDGSRKNEQMKLERIASISQLREKNHDGPEGQSLKGEIIEEIIKPACSWLSQSSWPSCQPSVATFLI